MSQIVEAMSDADLLGIMVGTKAASRMLQDAGGSLSTLLNESIPSYDLQPKIRTKLQVAKELVRRSLLETMRHRDVLSSPASTRLPAHDAADATMKCSGAFSGRPEPGHRV